MSSAQDPKPPTAGADLTDEERLAVVKEIYGRGSRNYLVKEYAQAADDLSEACALYAEIYGEGAHELGMPYLLYAKSLIALAQGGENKLLEVPEEQEDDDDEDDDGEENSEEAPAAPAAEEGEAAGTSNGKPSVNGTNGTTEPQAGGSGSAVPAAVNTDGAEEEDDDSPAANLQVAWEVLELAVKIFDKGGEASASNLADAYFELAEISLENSHFETAVRDYNNSLEINMKLPDNNLRLIAEIQYKIGLSHLMLDTYDASIVAFRKACEVLDAEIANQQSEPPQPERAAAIIEELCELKIEILNKITEVEEAQQQSVAEVKEEMAKLFASVAQPSAAGASSSSSSAANASNGSGSGGAGRSSATLPTAAVAPKATDISHLIKRKNPTAPAVTNDSKSPEGSPAKRQAM